MSKNNKLMKGGYFTDLHLGGKANSISHNEDCVNYVAWFCEQVKKDKDIDYIAFLGDWNQERSAIDILTLNYSHKCAKMLNELDLPIYFILGNHDLYRRHSREIHAIVQFENFSNFIPIYEPTVVDNIGDGVLFCPYLFHDEYKSLTKYSKIPLWAGHFEFEGFIITGYDIKMKGGPNPNDFSKTKQILSGHFHKRQTTKNITYIGNCFPTSFSDAGDSERGMATFNHSNNKLEFIDWPECPTYTITTLSALLENPKITKGARVKCTVDVPIDYSEGTVIRKKFIGDYDLRGFNLEENSEIRTAFEDTIVDEDIVTIQSTNTNDMICEMLGGIKTEHIDNQMLISIYQNLKAETS
jgi:DNA repair exonuclease SbcCD nuclease subunit